MQTASNGRRNYFLYQHYNIPSNLLVLIASFSEYLTFNELICKIKHVFLPVIQCRRRESLSHNAGEDGVKYCTRGTVHHCRATGVLLVYFQPRFLPASLGTLTCNADTVKRERWSSGARSGAQTDEVAVMWPFASAKWGTQHLRTKYFHDNSKTAEASGNDTQGNNRAGLMEI